jgi:(1->4)-alpha-D-glucan 1-alpha-D-glucosylmutase
MSEGSQTTPESAPSGDATETAPGAASADPSVQGPSAARQRSAVPGRTVPRATYRLQLTPSFTFAEAAELVPQLAALGISHLYLSPILEAVPGSTHGYDVVDPTRIRAELGGPEGLAALAARAHEEGLGLIADIVPNHVGLVSPANAWWWDTLRHGPEGRYGRHLDIRWRPGTHGQPTLLVPELGAPREDELAGDDLRLEHRTAEEAPDREGYRIVYHEHAWPVRPGTLADAGLDEDDVAGTLRQVEADRALLRDVLDRQHHRLDHWRLANDHLDHRRFFDVTTLGGVRIEDPKVFADVHAAILPRIADGTLDGVRIDHPDGLRDPVGYLRRLRDAVGPAPWIVVEKIIERGETPRAEWPIDGTVGYEVADLNLGLHIDPAAGPVLDDLQAELTGAPIDRTALADDAKRTALRTLFGAERRWITRELLAANPDLDEEQGHDALCELLVAWPVYRTYVRPEDGEVADVDRDVITSAAAAARTARPDLASTIDGIVELLLLRSRSDAADAFVASFQQLTGPVIAKGLEDTVLYRDLRFVAVNEVGGHPGELGRSVEEFHADSFRRQREQPTTMVLSSTHDTKRSHDVRARLAVLSQDPAWWAATVREVLDLASGHRTPGAGPAPEHEHLALQTLIGAWPIDHQRLTDYLVKAAREGKVHTDWLDPDDAYEQALTRWAAALLTDEPVRAAVERAVERIREPGWLTSLSMTTVALTTPGVPDIYQGSELWDLSLVDPDNRRPVDHPRRAALLAELSGAELSTALGDDAGSPPIDRSASPHGSSHGQGASPLDPMDEGRPKLWLIHQALAVRRAFPQAFGPEASYLPLASSGSRADHLIAYCRAGEVVVIAPRRVLGLGRRFQDWRWEDTTVDLPEGRWFDVLSGVDAPSLARAGAHPVAELLGRFPSAILTRMG